MTIRKAIDRKVDTIKELLKSLKVKGIVHNGDMDLTGCAPLIDRCLWYLPRQMSHFQWADGLNIDARKPYVKELIDALYHSESFYAMKQSYSNIINLLQEKNFVTAYYILKMQ